MQAKTRAALFGPKYVVTAATPQLKKLVNILGTPSLCFLRVFRCIPRLQG